LFFEGNEGVTNGLNGGGIDIVFYSIRIPLPQFFSLRYKVLSSK